MKYFAVLVLGLLLTPRAQAQCLSGNCYDGIGTYLYPSGAKYSGHFKHGKIHGYGRLIFSDGRIYEGEWRNHYRTGKGVLHFPKGDVYRGEFKKNKFYGFGTMEYSNGDVYQGSWKENFPNGHGVMTYHNGDHYDGYFRAGHKHGKGTMVYADGSKYTGQWERDERAGKGTYYLTNGEVLVGFWSEDQYIGSEPQVIIAETDIAGESATDNSENINNTSMLRNCNSMHCASGRGKYTYSDGSVYVGEFSRGIPYGQGTCYYSNGDKYTGEWGIAGPEGNGTYYFSNGRVAGGIWSSGRLVKTTEDSTPIQIPDGSQIDRDPAIKLWAIVVGVGDYEHIQKLKYSDDDAYKFYSFIRSPEGGAIPKEQVRLLVDEDATRENILKAMNEVYGRADENDIVVMFYSGHGIRGAFLPVNYNGFQNKLRHTEVTAILNASKAKYKIVFADACYSGSLLAMKSAAPLSIQDEHTKERFYEAFEHSKGGTAVILSSGPDEQSLEDQGLRQGLFTYYLIKGLGGEADSNHNKIIETAELYRYMKDNIHRASAGMQNPTIKGQFEKSMPVGVLR